MCADCCFNLAATLAAAALIIAERQESWRGPHLVHRSLARYLHSTTERASKQQGKCGGKLQSSHASQEGGGLVGACAVWRRQRNWENVLYILPVWRQKICTCISLFIVLLSLLNLCELRISLFALSGCWASFWLVKNHAFCYSFYMSYPVHAGMCSPGRPCLE